MFESLKNYPVAIVFLLGNEMCERFNFYGLRTVLSIYLKTSLGYNENTSTMVFHVFVMLCYFFPLFGAILADSFIGKFKTILVLSIVYSIGTLVLALASGLDSPRAVLTIVGLLLIALGTGGIKPCVAAFGGSQFELPAQELQLKRFFSMFYFVINTGSMVSTYLTPVLKTVSCSDTGTCYPLAFGVPSLLMIISTIIFVVGYKWYKMSDPEGNVTVKICKCMAHAVANKWRRNKEDPKKDHWLDYSDDTYDVQFIEDCKQVLHIIHLLLPMPFFWALYDQQGSRWTFQAQAMNGLLFNGKVEIEPEQMQVFNPFLILLFIPIFDLVIYPLCGKFNMLKTPLQKMSTGGFLAALAFVASAVVETQVEATYANVPGKGSAQLRLFNGLSCNLTVRSDAPCIGLTDTRVWSEVEPQGIWQLRDLIVDAGEQTILLDITGECFNATSRAVQVSEEVSTTYVVDTLFLDGKVEKVDALENVEKSIIGRPKLGVIYIPGDKEATMVLKDSFGDTSQLVLKGQVTDFTEYKSSKYEIWVKDDDAPPGSIDIEGGGVYIATYKKEFGWKLIEVASPNKIHMLWQLPQIVIITVAEIMFSITGLEFSFTQAPKSMQSLMQSMWLMTTAIGSVIVAIVSESKIFERQRDEFLLFAALMTGTMTIFVVFAIKYKYYVAT